MFFHPAVPYLPDRQWNSSHAVRWMVSPLPVSLLCRMPASEGRVPLRTFRPFQNLLLSVIRSAPHHHRVTVHHNPCNPVQSVPHRPVLSSLPLSIKRMSSSRFRLHTCMATDIGRTLKRYGIPKCFVMFRSAAISLISFCHPFIIQVIGIGRRSHGE